jgi:hypothetical protein
MNKVPHCKGCKHLDISTIGKHQYYFCYNPKNRIIGMKIYAIHRKTSPQWCILRIGKGDNN